MSFIVHAHGWLALLVRDAPVSVARTVCARCCTPVSVAHAVYEQCSAPVSVARTVCEWFCTLVILACSVYQRCCTPVSVAHTLFVRGVVHL